MFPLTQIHRLLALASLRPSRIRARRAYFTAQDTAGGVFGLLTGPAGRTAGARAQLLLDLGALERDMAAAVTDAWPGADARDDAQDMTSSGRLLEILASIESPSHRLTGPDDWEDAFGDVLDRLDGETSLKGRAVYLTSLYLAALPIVGSGAAETVAVIRNAYTSLALDAAMRDAGLGPARGASS